MSQNQPEPFDPAKHDEQTLIDELDAFYAKHGLEPRCALEQFHALLPEEAGQDTPEREAQRAWLQDYCERWDAMLEWHRVHRPKAS